MNYKTIQVGDPEVFETRQGGGGLALFGLPFFLLGLGMLALGLGLLKATEESMPWQAALPVGSIFAAVGALFLFGRYGRIIDRRRKIIVRWWGLLVPIKRIETPLEFYRRITLGREVRGDSDSSTTVYPVRLEGVGDTKPMEIEAPQVYEQARQLAEDLAKFLNWPLSDSSLGQTVTREPDQLDEPIQDRIRRSKAKAESATPPIGMRIQVQESGGVMTLDLPPAGIGLPHYFQIGGAVLFAGLVAYFFLGPILTLPMPTLLRFIFIGFIGIGFIFGPILTVLRSVLAAARNRVRVKVSKEFLRVEEPGIFRKKATEIPAGELEELLIPESQASPLLVRKLPDGTTLPQTQRMIAVGNFLSRLAPRPGLTARSDKISLEIGKGLSSEELTYLLAMIKKTLAE